MGVPDCIFRCMCMFVRAVIHTISIFLRFMLMGVHDRFLDICVYVGLSRDIHNFHISSDSC